MWEAWSETEAQIHRAFASYAMTRFQRNVGTRCISEFSREQIHCNDKFSIFQFGQLNFSKPSGEKNRPGAERMEMIKQVIKSELEAAS